MVTKRSSSAKENKQPIYPAPDADLDDFVLAKPGPPYDLLSHWVKHKWPSWRRVPLCQTLKKYSVGVEDLHWLVQWEKQAVGYWRQMSTGFAGKARSWEAKFLAISLRRWSQDGEPHPACMLYLLLAGQLRYGRSKSKLCSNFMDKSDSSFSELSGVCESVSRQLRKHGVGASVKHVAIITPEEENLLMDTASTLELELTLMESPALIPLFLTCHWTCKGHNIVCTADWPQGNIVILPMPQGNITAVTTIRSK